MVDFRIYPREAERMRWGTETQQLLQYLETQRGRKEVECESRDLSTIRVLKIKAVKGSSKFATL